MASETTMIGLHTIGEDGTLELDDEAFELTALERGEQCLVIASSDGGLTVMPVTEEFDPKPSGG